MRTLIFLLIAFFSLPFSAKSQAPCKLEGMTAEVVDCVFDDFYVILNFEYHNVVSDSFVLRGNGHLYGTYAYADLPLTLGPLAANGTTPYEFVALDANLLHDCSTFVELGVVSCAVGDCAIVDLVVETGDCDAAGNYEVWVDFEVINPTNQHFDIWLNNTFYGNFGLANLPLYIPNFPTNAGPNDVVKVCINDNADCCAVLEFPVPDCTGGACEIYDLTVETGDCTASGGYEAWVNFQVHNPTNQHFDIWLNNTFYGNFGLANLPLYIPNFPTNAGPNDVVKVCINDNPDCCAILEFPVPDCTGCAFSDVQVLATPCLCGEFFAILTFERQNGGNGGFDILGNGQNYGTFNDDDTQPIILGPFVGDGMTSFEFVLQDHNHPDCSSVFELGPVICGPMANEEISDVFALTCSPNPAIDVVQISAKNGTNSLGKNSSIQIFSTDGKEVYFTDNQVNTSSASLNIGHLPKGHYRIILKSDKNTWQGEFVKH